MGGATATQTSFRQSMAWLHTWTGLLPGWLLFVIFLFGTTAFFQQEISQWMRPELRNGGVTDAALDAASRYLALEAPDAANWRISLPPERGGEALSVSWKPRDGGRAELGKVSLDPVSGQKIAVRDTKAGGFLYRMHFDLHYMPYWLARYFVSIAGLAMLVAILSGIVTHKKIFADFFLLRLGKGQRSWLDVHNLTAVVALPFQLMMTYTGLVTLLFTLMPWAITANFPSKDAFFEAAYPSAPNVEVTGDIAPTLPFGRLVERAEAIWGAPPRVIIVNNPGDAAAMVELRPPFDRLDGDLPPLYFHGVTGALLQAPSLVSGAEVTREVMGNLHTGLFAGPTLRWLLFLSGVGGTVMISTGLVLWTIKRRAKLLDPVRPHFGFALVERLNIGVIAGAPAGIAIYFLANRLLPLNMAHRADWEINSLFIAWGAVFVWTLALPARRAWTQALAVCAALYMLVPVVNALTTTRGLIPSLIARDWVFVGFDLTMLATSVTLALAARKVANHKPKAASRRKARELVEAAT